ncbi:uncharacterized protein LOC142588529 isoform X1 [Dermacentor variabilis]|uniref:uncharacterized protein LOC142588529 isoform X1 n=1 Tax=Dermacentor variabilis TaxID=34621 RepID=UPI003F5B4537
MQHRPSCRLDSACPRDVVALLLLLLAVREVTPAAYIHQACDSDADCASVANTFCKGEECICLPKFSRSYPPCNEGIELGESCSRHENCEVNDNNSYCHHSICRCKPLFRRVLLVSENITRCRRGHEPRESCYNVEDCNGSNYTCYEGLCRCREGFYKDEETDGCRPRRYLDETCARDSDCDSLVNNSYCSNDHCECKNGYIREGVLPDEQQCEIDRGGRGALKILFALMLPVVVCAFVYLYRNRKVNQANKNQPGEEDQQSAAASPAPLGTYSTDTGVKSPSMNTPLSPMPPDIITGSPIEIRTTMAAADTRGKPPCTFSIMV